MNWFSGRLYLYNAGNTYVTFHQAQKLMDEHPGFTSVYHPAPIEIRSSNYGR